MEYIKLILGLGLTVTFIWLAIKNSNRTNFIHALLRIDTMLGVFAGVYLTFTSVHSLLLQ